MAELNIEEILNKISSEPDILSKISEISKESKSKDSSSALTDMIEALSPLFKESNKSPANDTSIPEKSDTSPENSSATEGLLSLPILKITEQIKKNSALLSALKPYLRKARSDMIDNVLKMAQVADLMRLIK